MNAAEFIAKFGWELAQRDVVCLETGFIKKADFLEHYGFEILDEIKTYVDAWELVQNFGGLNKALEMINNPICFGDANFEVEAQLRKAITLVEEVESLKEIC